MAFDHGKYFAAADHADLGRTTLFASIALSNLKWALEELAKKSGVDISTHLEYAQKSIDELDKHFDEITGYTPDE